MKTSAHVKKFYFQRERNETERLPPREEKTGGEKGCAKNVPMIIPLLGDSPFLVYTHTHTKKPLNKQLLLIQKESVLFLLFSLPSL